MNRVQRLRNPTITGPVGLGDFDLTSIPIIGGVFQWAEDQARNAVNYIREKYLEYVAAKQLIPTLELQQKRAAALVVRDGRTDLQSSVTQWGTAVADAKQVVQNGDGKVTQIVQAYNNNTSGLGVWWMAAGVLAVLGIAIYTVNNTIGRVSDAFRLSQFVKAGLNPEQIADVYHNAETGSSDSFFGQIKTLALIGVGVAVISTVLPMIRQKKS